MKFKNVQNRIERTPEEMARIQAIRKKFQAEKPSIEQLLATGEYTQPVPLATYLETKELLHDLKQEREQAGLSLTDVANRTGMDKAAISRLENGRQQNPTVETLSRYAMAIGKQLVWTFLDIPARQKSPSLGDKKACDSENMAEE
jgi:ribosome-binding protein aMBF1 (putative translation factor)